MPQQDLQRAGGVLHIRTFADDIKRAQSLEQHDAVEAHPSAQRTVPIIPIPKHARHKSKEEKLQEELARHAMPIPDAPHNSATEIHRHHLHDEHGAFNINEAANEIAHDGTIVRDRRARRSSIIEQLGNAAREWYQTTIVPLIEDQRGAAEIRMDIAPNVQSPAWTIQEALKPTPAMRTLAQDAEDVHEGKKSALPPLPTPTWKRVSEPRGDMPLRHTTNNELEAYRSALRTKPKATAPLPQPFKKGRVVRKIAESYETEARARLARLAQPHEGQRSASRDEIFVPPPLADTKQAVPIRTYRYDALSDIRDKKLSAQAIAAQESIRRDRTGVSMRDSAPQRQPVRWIVPVLGTLTLCISIVLAIFIFYPYLTTTHRDDASVGNPAFFVTSVHKTVFLDQDRIRFLEELTTARLSLELDAGSFAHLAVAATENDVRPALSEDIMAIIEPRVPGAFLRSLSPTLMFGAYDTDRAPFLVLKTDSFEIALAGMLAWEQTMSVDLEPYFGGVVRRSFDASALTRDQTREAFFKDTIVKNRDARILVDEYNNERIAYLFFDPSTILIASDTRTLEALIGALE